MPIYSEEFDIDLFGYTDDLVFRQNLYTLIELHEDGFDGCVNEAIGFVIGIEQHF